MANLHGDEQKREKRGRISALERYRKYRVTPEQWEAMQSRHGNLCWVCGRENKKRDKVVGLVLDHCHESGKVRGALCDRCNQLLGLLGDTLPKLLESRDRIIRYLQAAETLDLDALLKERV